MQRLTTALSVALTGALTLTASSLAGAQTLGAGAPDAAVIPVSATIDGAPLPPSGFAPRLEVPGIRDIQMQLRAHGYDSGPATGVMNWTTYRAILAYQHDYGLRQDGAASPILQNELHFLPRRPVQTIPASAPPPPAGRAEAPPVGLVPPPPGAPPAAPSADEAARALAPAEPSAPAQVEAALPPAPADAPPAADQAAVAPAAPALAIPPANADVAALAPASVAPPAATIPTPSAEMVVIAPAPLPEPSVATQAANEAVVILPPPAKPATEQTALAPAPGTTTWGKHLGPIGPPPKAAPRIPVTVSSVDGPAPAAAASATVTPAAQKAALAASAADPLQALRPAALPDEDAPIADDTVAEAQELLTALGFYSGKADGILNWATVDALIKFDASGSGPASVIADATRPEGVLLARLRMAAATKPPAPTPPSSQH